jgi:hypothetical protein
MLAMFSAPDCCLRTGHRGYWPLQLSFPRRWWCLPRQQHGDGDQRQNQDALGEGVAPYAVFDFVEDLLCHDLGARRGQKDVAEIVVIERAKARSSRQNAGRTSGSVTRRNVPKLSAPERRRFLKADRSATGLTPAGARRELRT